MRTRKLSLALALAASSLAVGAGAAVAASPTDPMAAGQQPLSIIRVGEALDLAGAPPADVPVLVADTGLDLDHPALAPRLLGPPAANSDLIGTPAPPNAVPDSDPSDPPPPYSGHGTLVAGILAAAWNNGVGGAGVAPNARLIPMRSCWDDDQCYQYIQADAFSRAIEEFGARVVSMSWLVGEPEPGFAAAIRDHPNTLFVAIPSGNGGATNADPDAANRAPCSLDYDNVLCVTTSGPGDGLSCGDYGANLVDVAAPTENSVTTQNGGGFTATGCATSFAAPTAAGVATILFGLSPTATPAQVRGSIIAGARPVAAWKGKSVSGGVLDAVGAVSALISIPSDATPPQTKIKKGPKKVSKKARPKFTFSSSEPGSTFECKLDKRKFRACSSPKKLGKLRPGKHVFRVRAVDLAGNEDPSPAKRRFRVG
jgi:subtilisin family serine protease